MQYSVNIESLGDGAYSTVYKVKRISDGQVYALKKVSDSANMTLIAGQNGSTLRERKSKCP